MKFSVKIDMNNAAFEDPEYELGRILNALAQSIPGKQISPGTEIVIRDINGNRVGLAKVTR